MDFALNDDQLELKQAARAWLADRFPLDRDWDAQDDRWSEIEEMGWTDVAEEDEAGSGGGGRAPLAAAAAKAFATEAAVAACERSIQAHGGIGFTWEHPLHRFYKRALWLEGFGRRPAELRLEVADAVLA